jgi:hypothetical protein
LSDGTSGTPGAADEYRYSTSVGRDELGRDALNDSAIQTSPNV